MINNEYKNYVFFDIIINGLNVSQNEIIKFYYTKTDNKCVVQECEDFFVNTNRTKIDKKVAKLINITNLDIKTGKSGKYLLEKLKNLFQGNTLIVGYNLPITIRFVYNFLKRYKEEKILSNLHCLDLLETFKNNEISHRYKLIDAVNFYNINKDLLQKNESLIYLELFKQMNEKYKLQDVDLLIN